MVYRSYWPVVNYCTVWNLKCNLNKCKIFIFRKNKYSEEKREIDYV
jgi:hypothetical protein